ncbi:hypothetical protein Tco_0813240 [Tanacetum coccineum]
MSSNHTLAFPDVTSIASALIAALLYFSDFPMTSWRNVHKNLRPSKLSDNSSRSSEDALLYNALKRASLFFIGTLVQLSVSLVAELCTPRSGLGLPDLLRACLGLILSFKPLLPVGVPDSE